MGKYACKGCGGSHQKATQRLNCLTKHGSIKRKGNKRTDAVVTEHVSHMHQPKEEKMEEEDHSKEEDYSKETQNPFSSMLQVPKPSFSNVTLVENISMLRHGGYRVINKFAPFMKHRNFSRMLKNDKEKEEGQNIIQELIEEQEDLQDEETYKIIRSFLGKNGIRKKVQAFQQKNYEMMEILTNQYIQYCLANETKYWISNNSKEIRISVEKRKEIKLQCQADVSAYYQLAHFGKICSFDARFQPIQELIAGLHWKDYLKKKEQLRQKRRISELSQEQQQIQLEKQQLFKQFQRMTYFRIKPFLYRWKKRIYTNEVGEIKIQRYDPQRMKQKDYKETYQWHLSKIKPIFERLYNFYKYEQKFNGRAVQDDLWRYPAICERLKHYHLELNKKLKERREQQYRMYVRQWNYIKKVKKQRIERQGVIRSEYKYEKQKWLIETEDELNQCLIYLMIKKHDGDYQELFDKMSINCKLMCLNPRKNFLIPQKIIVSKKTQIQNQIKGITLVYFKQSTETLAMLDRLLTKDLLTIDKQKIKGYTLHPKIKKYQGSGLEPHNFELSVWMKQNRTPYFKKREGNIQKQLKYLQTYEQGAKMLHHIDFLLGMYRWRGRKITTMTRVIVQEKSRSKNVEQFLNVFPNFFYTDQDNHIVCPNIPTSERRLKEFQQLEHYVKQIRPIETPLTVQEDRIFEDISYEFSGKLIKFSQLFLPYQASKKRDYAIIKRLTYQASDFTELNALIKSCFVCKQNFTVSERKRKICSYCFTQLHQNCSKSLVSCFCQNEKIEIQKINDPNECSKVYYDMKIEENDLLSRKKYQGIKTFEVQTAQQVIKQEEIKITSILAQREIYVYSLSSKVHECLKNIKIDRFSDPFLTDADLQLTKAYRQYAKGRYKAPVKLKIHSQNNYGIESLETIPKNTLLCQYGADIVPSSYCSHMKWKHHIMLYSQGKTSRDELVLIPFNICNWGPLLNHSQQGNCGSLRIIIDNCIRVLLYTNKRIQAGQELLYNYNGYYHDFPTDGFQDYTSSQKT